MKLLKKIAKSVFDYKSQQYVKPLKNLTYLGSTYHGYHIPNDYLSASSICYCIGAGTDISLDVELATTFNAQVYIFDPMPYALDHFNKLVLHTKQGKVFTSNEVEGNYAYNVSSEQLSAVSFLATGIWDEKKIVKFYSPSKENYAGHSITNLQNTEEYIEAPVDKLINIMQELGHQQLDLLKIEIEGSEYVVIDDMLSDKIDVKIVLVEFDEFHHRKGKELLSTIKRIEQSTQKLIKAGYKLVHSISFYKRTFVREDIVKQLLDN